MTHWHPWFGPVVRQQIGLEVHGGMNWLHHEPENKEEEEGIMGIVLLQGCSEYPKCLPTH